MSKQEHPKVRSKWDRACLNNIMLRFLAIRDKKNPAFFAVSGAVLRISQDRSDPSPF